MRTALFPGSFDPFTIGHQQIVDRTLPLFDKVVIAVGVNRAKTPFQSVEQRVESISRLYAGDERVEVVAYETLTIDLASRCDARYIIRGVRTNADFEYERTIADTNRALAGLETIFIISDPSVSHVSSSLVRELASFGHDVSAFLPK